MTQTHAGLPVAGYRRQSAEAVSLVNDNKNTEEKILRLIDSLRNGMTPEGESIEID